MEALLKVRIKNFQSLKDFSLEFEGFSVLVGPSNIGKSSICRAIEAALFGRLGKGFVSTGASHSEVQIEDKDFSIKWKKGDKVNSLELDGKLYEKLGRDVPDGIKRLGFREVDIDNRTINVQVADQFEPIFLLNDNSSTALAILLTEVSRLGKFNQAMTLCSRDLKRSVAEITASKNLLSTMEKDLKVLEDKRNRIGDVDAVLTEAEGILSLSEDLGSLEDLNSRLGRMNYVLSQLENLPVLVEIDFDSDLELLSSLESISSRLRELKLLEPNYENLPKLDQIDGEGSFQDFSELSDLSSRLGSLVDQESSEQNRILRASTRLAEIDARYEEIRDVLKVCPFCERPWENSHVH